MKKKILSISVITSLVIASCGTKSNKNTTESEQKNVTEAVTTANTERDIPFTQARGYFVKNSYKDDELVSPKISSQEEFDKIFGMAATMGENGKPTYINFPEQYVIAVIGEITDRSTTLTVNSLKQKDTVIILNYKKTVGEKQSWTMQPSLVLIVDNKYQGVIKAEKN